MKPRTVYTCQECGAQSAKWLGRCSECGAWNSLVEERPAPETVGGAAADAVRRYSLGVTAGPQLYADIDTVVAERLSSGIGEFDRVLGGGVVPGSLVLIGGEPGIGKSTLLLQAAAHFAKHVGPVLYSSGEESEHQIKSRGQRLGIESAPLYILAETCLERILEEIARLRPAFVIVDSIQRRSCCSPRRGRTSRRSSSATSRRTARWPAPRRSSTLSTPSCTSRARSTTRTASSAPSRTASARSASSACSR
jgi:DNA repair protein RadA/Sms